MSPHEFARPVADRVGAGEHRAALEVAANIVRQFLGRNVPARRLLLHRPEHDGVEVAPQLGRGGTRTRRRAAGVPRFDGAARRRGIGLAHGANDLLHRVGLHCVRPTAGQDLVEQHTEGIDVARRRHRLAADLLGARVLGRHHRQHRGGRRGVGVDPDRQQPGDAEVEELRRAVRRDQDVVGLQVAVDDEVLVRVLDGGAHFHEQGEAIPRIEAPLVAIQRDRASIDVLHHQVGLTLRGRAAVEDGRDVRVLQERQDLTLLAKPPLGVLRGGAAAHQLQSDRLLERVVVTDRPIDGAHPPGGDYVEHAVGTDAGPGGALCRLRESGRQGSGLREESSRFLVRRQERLDFAPQLGVGLARFIEKRGAPCGRADHRVLEHFSDAQPARSCQRTFLVRRGGNDERLGHIDAEFKQQARRFSKTDPVDL